MKTLLALLLLTLCSIANAEIMGIASVYEHHPSGQPNIIDWVRIRCQIFTSAPATDYQTVSGFTNHCEVVENGGIVIRNYGTLYSPPLNAPGYVELLHQPQEVCLDGGVPYHVELDSYVSLDNGGSYIGSDDSPTHIGFCYC